MNTIKNSRIFEIGNFVKYFFFQKKQKISIIIQNRVFRLKEYKIIFKI